MKIINFISKGLSYFERTIIVILLGSMVLLAFAQVLLRNVFSTGFLWADPLLRHLVLWICFVGGSIATQESKHINIDMVTRFTSPRITNLIHVFTSLFAMVICVIMANAGWTFLLDEKETASILFTVAEKEYPIWWFETIIPVGFALIGFRMLLKSIEHLVHFIRPQAEQPVAPTEGMSI